MLRLSSIKICLFECFLRKGKVDLDLDLLSDMIILNQNKRDLLISVKSNGVSLDKANDNILIGYSVTRILFHASFQEDKLPHLEVFNYLYKRAKLPFLYVFFRLESPIRQPCRAIAQVKFHYTILTTLLTT